MVEKMVKCCVCGNIVVESVAKTHWGYAGFFCGLPTCTPEMFDKGLIDK